MIIKSFEMDRVLELMDFLKQFDLMESISLNGQSYANKKEMENIDYMNLIQIQKQLCRGREFLLMIRDVVKEQSTTVEKDNFII